MTKKDLEQRVESLDLDARYWEGRALHAETKLEEVLWNLYQERLPARKPTFRAEAEQRAEEFEARATRRLEDFLTVDALREEYERETNGSAVSA